MLSCVRIEGRETILAVPLPSIALMRARMKLLTPARALPDASVTDAPPDR